MGRVVGFFDEDRVFNVVLLDPLHNIQPSKTYNYRVRASYIAQCQLTKLTVTMENLIRKRADLEEKQRTEMLAELRAQNMRHYDAAVHLTISDEHLHKAYEYASVGLITDLGELLQLTIDELSKQ